MDPTYRPLPIPRLFHVRWLIPSPAPRPETQVSWSSGTWMCSCDTFQRRHQPKGEICHHIQAVQQRIADDPSAWALPTRAEIVARHWRGT